MSAEIQKKVNEICNDLYRKGEKVSVRAVLSRISDISSTSTAHKYVKSWRDTFQSNQQSLIEQLGFSEQFTQSFLQELTRFNAEAKQHLHEAAEQAKEQTKESIEDLERIETELKDRISQLEADKLKLAQNNESLRTEVAHEIKENQRQMAKELHSTHEQIAKQSATIAKLTTNTEWDVKRIEELNDDVTKYRRLLAESEEQASKLKEINRQLETGLSALNIQLDNLTKDNADKERRLAQQENLIDKLTANLPPVPG